jgi:hypothetical protein
MAKLSIPFLRGASALLALGALLAVGGCKFVTVIGDDTTVSGSWTVMGETPSAANCAAIGVDTVRLVIFDGGARYTDPLLTANCSAGSIDTRPTPILSAGIYTARWEAVRSGEVVAMGPERSLDSRAATHVIMNSLNLTGATPPFDPTGTDASVEAHWTVQGTAPTLASCGALGIDRVRIAFFDTVGTAYEYTALTANCEDGAFDTRPTRVIAAGTWTVQFQAVDTAGTVLGSGAMATVTVAAGGHLSLYDGAPVDFSSGAFNPMGSDATLSASWTLNGQIPTEDNCYAAGVDRVRVLFHPATDTGFEEGVMVAMVTNCELGLINTAPTAVIRAGSYLVSVEALDYDGELISALAPTTTPFTVTPGSAVTVTPVNFTFDPILALAIDWERAAGGATDCAGAGVSTMLWRLANRTTSATIAMSSAGAPCVEDLFFEQGIDAGFGPGPYRFYFEGYDAGGTKHWQVTTGACDVDINATTNSLEFLRCIGEYTP